MNIKIFSNKKQMSIAAAAIFLDQVISKPNTVLGLATGSTIEDLYAYIRKMYEENLFDASQLVAFNLDEYMNIDRSHCNSFYYFMYQNLFKHINIKEENIHIPSLEGRELDAFCNEYENMISKAGGIDLQFLGLGRNAHIAFNEPSSSFSKNTHIVKLTESTIKANSRFFNSVTEVPRMAVTMGIGTIMKSRKIVLLANGREKADAINAMIKGPVSPEVPASILQFHPNVVLLCDELAASKL